MIRSTANDLLTFHTANIRLTETDIVRWRNIHFQFVSNASPTVALKTSHFTGPDEDKDLQLCCCYWK